ncbi:hypothetical protein GPROT1_01836 [Gammaproteobacteria bacterium]|nr:hypothetical protein GPROT1_01836 [Gammaproteobacteria bacterium]
MLALLHLAQHAPDFAGSPELAAAEMDWTFLIISTLLSIVAQAIFGYWAMMKAEEHDSNKVAAFIMGFLFLYLGVRMVPILRKDRIFNKPIVPRPLPPRPPKAGMPHMHGQPVQPAAPQQAPPAADVCPTCGAPRRPGRKLCMTCGATLPSG